MCDIYYRIDLWCMFFLILYFFVTLYSLYCNILYMIYTIYSILLEFVWKSLYTSEERSILIPFPLSMVLKI